MTPVKQRAKAGYADTYTELPGMGIHALGPNAVLVIDGDGWTGEAAAALKDALRPDVLLVVGNDDTIRSLDESAMRELGWVRA